MNIEEKLKSGKETVAFRIDNAVPSFSEYAHIVVDVVYVDDSAKSCQLAFYNNYFSDKRQYKGLKVKAQMDGERELPYGWSLVIEDHDNEIDLEKAESMTKTLRPINRKLNKINEAEGYVETFEEFIIRLGRVLGVKAFFTKTEGLGYSKHSDMSRLRSRIRSYIRENQASLGFKQAA